MPSNHIICGEVLIALRRISQAIDLQSKKLMQTCGVTGPQLLVMQVVNYEDSVTVGNLADQVNLSQATVTSILDRLEKRELVLRTRSHEDKRKVFVSLTDSGREALRQAPTLLQEHFVDAFSQLRDWEQTLILSSLQRVAEMMHVQDLDADPLLDVDALVPSAEVPPVPGSSGSVTSQR